MSFEIEDIIADRANGEITVALNTTPSSEVVAILALYNSDGKLIYTAAADIESDAVVFNAELTDVTLVRVFIWNSLSGMKPLAPAAQTVNF